MVELLLQMLPLILLYSAPMIIAVTCFSFVFWGIPLSKVWKRTVFFALVEAIYVDLLIHLIELPAYFLHTLTSFLILFVMFFHDVGWKKALKLGITAYAVNTITEIVYSGLLLIGFGRFELTKEPELILTYLTPLALAIGAVTWLMSVKQYHLGNQLIQNLGRTKKSGFYYLMLLLFLQFIMVAFIIALHWEQSDPTKNYLVYSFMILMLGLSILIVLLTMRAVGRSKDHVVSMTQQHYIDHVSSLFTTVRGQRHDFLNHVQVIRSLAQTGRIEQLKNYTAELVGEVKEINDILLIGHPALAALIQSKLVASTDENIDFLYDFSNVEGLSLGVKSIDIIKIAGNLIDNALDEVKKLSHPHRWIHVKGWMEGQDLYLTVHNPSKGLSEEEKNMLFIPGYSTKPQDGESRGLGLAIVKDRVDYYKGDIEVESCPDTGTLFKVKIPLVLSN